MSKQISILGVDFDVATPYVEGHIITAPEAKALNQTRAENIANNWRKKVKEANGDEAVIRGIKKSFAQYDHDYVFTLASAGGSRSTMTPLEKESRKVARSWLINKLKAASKTLKSYTEEHDAEYAKGKIAEVAEIDAILKIAAENIKEAEKRATKQLDIDIPV